MTSTRKGGVAKNCHIFGRIVMTGGVKYWQSKQGLQNELRTSFVDGLRGWEGYHYQHQFSGGGGGCWSVINWVSIPKEKFWLENQHENQHEIQIWFCDMSQQLISSKFLIVILAWKPAWKTAWTRAGFHANFFFFRIDTRLKSMHQGCMNAASKLRQNGK